MFRRPIIADPSRVVIYSKAAIALHNYLRTEESSVYCPPGFVDGEDGSGNVIDGAWRRDEVPVTGLESLRHVGGNRYNNLSTSLVDKLYSVHYYSCITDTRDLLLTSGMLTKTIFVAQLVM